MTLATAQFAYQYGRHKPKAAMPRLIFGKTYFQRWPARMDGMLNLTRRGFAMMSGVIAASAASKPFARAYPARSWIESWGTAQPIIIEPAMPIAPPPPPVANPSKSDKPVTPPPPPMPMPPDKVQGTVRMIARTSIGGDRIRLSFSNPIGADIVKFGAVRVAVLGPDLSIVPGTDRKVSFGGKTTTDLFSGALRLSDPIDLRVPALTKIIVSIYLPEMSDARGLHRLGLNPTTILPGGDSTAAPVLRGGSIFSSYLWLTGIAVESSAHASTIVALGDSITDGFATTPGTNSSWPELLARRMQTETATADTAVINMGVSGGRVLRVGAGASALARLDRDVLARPGVRWVILLEGINDITFSLFQGAPETQRATADQIIDGYRQIIDRCHLHGIKVMGGTITPVGGLPIYNEYGEIIRTTVNRWIRTSGMFDEIVDFDVATRDPAKPGQLFGRYDPGDHVHPNDLGNRAMANAINLAHLR